MSLLCKYLRRATHPPKWTQTYSEMGWRGIIKTKVKSTMEKTNVLPLKELRELRELNRRQYKIIPPSDHQKIAHQHLVDKLSYRKLGKMYGVSHSRIQQIVNAL